MSDNERNRSCSVEKRRIKTHLGVLSCSLLSKTAGKPTLLFWPSVLVPAVQWVPFWGRFADRFNIVVIDPPGHGQSSPLYRVFSLEECALSVTQLLDALEVESCYFAGCSWGAMVGGVFAALYPARVKAVLLISGTASPASLTGKGEFMAFANLLRLWGGVPDILVKRVVRSFLGKLAISENARLVEELSAAIKNQEAESIGWILDSLALHRPDHRHLLGNIHCPALVIAGEEDRAIENEETEAMAEAISGAQYICLSGVGHLAPLESPDQVATLFTDFLSLSVSTE